MAFSEQPPARPSWPIAIRLESITTTELETIITVRNSPEPWHPLNYTIADQNGATLYTVHGHPWSLAQRRVFHDASGLPLFELRSRWYDSSLVELKLPGATAASKCLLSGKCRVAVQAPRAVLRFRNACLHEMVHTYQDKHKKTNSRTSVRPLNVEDETVMEIFALDVDNHVQVAVVGDQRIAFIDRVTDPAVLAQGQKPPFRFRPMWKVRIAKGVDLALVGRH